MINEMKLAVGNRFHATMRIRVKTFKKVLKLKISHHAFSSRPDADSNKELTTSVQSVSQSHILFEIFLYRIIRKPTGNIHKTRNVFAQCILH